MRALVFTAMDGPDREMIKFEVRYTINMELEDGHVGLQTAICCKVDMLCGDPSLHTVYSEKLIEKVKTW